MGLATSAITGERSLVHRGVLILINALFFCCFSFPHPSVFLILCLTPEDFVNMHRYPPANTAVSIDQTIPTDSTVNMLFEHFNGRSSSAGAHKQQSLLHHSSSTENLTPPRSRRQSIARYQEQRFDSPRKESKERHLESRERKLVSRKKSFDSIDGGSGSGTGTGGGKIVKRQTMAPISPVREKRESFSLEQSDHRAPKSQQPVHSNIADFYSPEVFRVVLNNPTTAHRLKRFCQSRACGEDMEYLQKVSAHPGVLCITFCLIIY